MGARRVVFYRLMRAYVKLAVCLVCFFLYLIVSTLTYLALIFLHPVHKRRIISKLIRVFALSLTKIINIRVAVTGQAPSALSSERGFFFVSNHSGYVDGLVLGSQFPVIYVSKAELKKWPIIGLMTEVAGTLFIDRQRKNHISQYIEDIAAVLKEGANVLFFPEGTSTNGEELLSFKPAFFEAPLAAGSPIVPISLVYKSIDGEPVTKKNRDSLYWYGDMTFADHFFRLLELFYIDVEVRLHPAIILDGAVQNSQLRKQASDLAYEAILSGIHPKASMPEVAS